MKRRSAVSCKISPDSQNCQLCSMKMGIYNCMICKKVLCDNCICDQNKYCVSCDNQSLRESKNTYVRVPTGKGKFRILVIKNNCCFM